MNITKFYKHLKLILIFFHFLYSGCTFLQDIKIKTPLIDRLSTNWILANKVEKLIIFGKNFSRNCSVKIDGKMLETEYINSRKLSTVLDRELIKLDPSTFSKVLKLSVIKSDSLQSDIFESNSVSISIRQIPLIDSVEPVFEVDGIYENGTYSFISSLPGYLLINWSIYNPDTGQCDKKTIYSMDNGQTWSVPKNIDDSFFVHEKKIYKIEEYKLYRTEDFGDNWTNLGEKPYHSLMENETIDAQYLRVLDKTNMIYVLITKSPDLQENIYTYYSNNFGKNWIFIGSYSFEAKDYGIINGVRPDILLNNNSGGIILSFYYWYGRHPFHLTFVSSDMGKNFKKGRRSGVFGNLDEDNNLYGVHSSVYIGFIMSTGFGYYPNLGLDEGYYYNFDDTFPEEFKHQRASMCPKVLDRLFVYKNNWMSCSYDMGKSWLNAESFIDEKLLNNENKILPHFDMEGNFYSLIITQNDKILIALPNSKYLINHKN